jgi:exopolysaccharide biosynthesis polyprenyl glycosylphosphotransferase
VARVLDRGTDEALPRASEFTLEERRGVRRLLEGRGWVAACIVSDALLLLLAVGAAMIGADDAGAETSSSWPVWLFPPLAMGLMALRRMYRPRIEVRALDEAAHVIGAISAASMTVLAFYALTTDAGNHAGMVARVWAFGLVYVAGGRLVLGLSQRRARIQRVVGKPTLIVGAGKVGAQVERRLEEKPELGLRPVGYIDANPAPDELVPGRRAPVLGGPSHLAGIVTETGAEHVVMAFLSARGSDAKLVPTVRECEELGLEVSLVPRLFENINVRAEMEHIGGMPLFQLHSPNPKGWQFAVKHVLDRIVAGALVLLLSPALLASALAVKLSSPGPVFFRQRRVGRDARPFDLLKFRSMSMGAASPSDTAAESLPADTAPGGVEGDDRRTAIGRLLRRTSIDELPQLFNVLKGEMSIVGPRPERPEFVELFEQNVERYEDRHRVKAGITGWAQVHGLRGRTSLADRIEWDNYYITNWSLWLDFKILLMTVVAVFRDDAE